jgi:hypothetical protein
VTLAVRLSGPLAPVDGAANAITDGMNAAVPWLWWPLAVPARDAPMPAAANALYAVHAVVLQRAARLAGVDVGPVPATVLAAAGWPWFTGAWDRRAAQLAAAAQTV